MKKNVFYYRKISSIGGVESWLYYLSKLYKNMVVYYKTGDKDQIDRLSKNIETHKYTGGKIECENFFCNYDPDIIDEVDAKEYIMVVHCDYNVVKFRPMMHPKFTKFIGVSKVACDSFTRLTGKQCELIYNPIYIEKPKRVLKLISATRLSQEKGKNRMKKLADMLSDANIPFIWNVFTNDKHEIDNPNISYMEPRMNIIDYVADADYLVQLSDCEAFCYSVVEALSVGTPVIVTDLPVFKELKLNKSNSIILNLDMSNVDVEQIYNSKFDFKYTPPKSNWDKYLDNNSDYDPNKRIYVKPLIKFTDIELKKGVSPITRAYPVSVQRAEDLIGKRFVKEVISKDNAKISIITPYYKCLNEINNLASVLEPQLNKNIEWIIVDDGCNEKQLDKLKANVIHLKENSGGASIPRNIGLDNAKGDYILFIDADDMITFNYIETIEETIKTNDFDYCYISWKKKDGDVIIKDIPPSWNRCVWNCIYTKKIIGKKRFKKELVIGEDWDFNNQVRRGTYTTIEEPLYIYNVDMPNSLSKRGSEKR